MIARDQPVCFPSELTVAVSSRNDGSMLNREKGVHASRIVANRKKLCEAVGISYDDVVYQWINYNTHATYDIVAEVDTRSTTRYDSATVADAVITDMPGVGVFLPLADCVGTVVYDPVRRKLAVLHLGRHSTLTSLVQKTVAHLQVGGSDPRDLLVWMSPSIRGASYRLDYFDKKDDPNWESFAVEHDDGVSIDLAGYNQARFIEAGVLPGNITLSSVDTAVDQNYFSHFQGDRTDRFAIVAMIRL